jgi:hypothetical protein
LYTDPYGALTRLRWARRQRLCHNGIVMPILTRPIRAVAVAVILGATATGCSTSEASAPTTRPTTSTTILRPPTTTTLAIPGALRPNAENAAAALVLSWASGNKAKALSVATSQAVATLFAAPYTSGLVIDRGCTSAFPPIVCTYGPPGGGPPNAPIFQLYVSQTPEGWYVSSVQIES